MGHTSFLPSQSCPESPGSPRQACDLSCERARRATETPWGPESGRPVRGRRLLWEVRGGARSSGLGLSRGNEEGEKTESEGHEEVAVQGLVAQGRCGRSACLHPEASPFSSSQDPTVPPSSALQSLPGALLLPSSGPTGLPFPGTSLHFPMQSSHQSPGKPPGVPKAGPSLVPSDLWDPCVCPAPSCPSEHPPVHSGPFRGCASLTVLSPPHQPGAQRAEMSVHRTWPRAGGL